MSEEITDMFQEGAINEVCTLHMLRPKSSEMLMVKKQTYLATIPTKIARAFNIISAPGHQMVCHSYSDAIYCLDKCAVEYNICSKSSNGLLQLPEAIYCLDKCVRPIAKVTQRPSATITVTGWAEQPMEISSRMYWKQEQTWRDTWSTETGTEKGRWWIW